MRPRRGLPRRSCRMEHNQSHSLFLLPSAQASVFPAIPFPSSSKFDIVRRLRHAAIRLIYQQDRGKACERCGFCCIEEFLFGNLHGLHSYQCEQSSCLREANDNSHTSSLLPPGFQYWETLAPREPRFLYRFFNSASKEAVALLVNFSVFTYPLFSLG
jgi:hypothetical protein